MKGRYITEGRYKYEDLEKHFTRRKAPMSPFYGDVRIPRKLKKKAKARCFPHWEGLRNGQRLWYYGWFVNPDYRSYLIKILCNET